MVAGRVFSNVEAYMATTVSSVDKDITKGRVVCLNSKLAPVQRPEWVFDDLCGSPGSVHNNCSVQAAPRDVVICISYDWNSVLVEFVTPPNDGLVASFADDFLNSVEFKTSLDAARKNSASAQPLVLSRDSCHLYYQ